MTTKEKKKILMRFFQLQTYLLQDFSFYMGKPLSYYDYELLKKEIKNLENLYNKL